MSLVVVGNYPTGAVVRSTANPPSAALMLLRRALQRRADLRELFLQFKAENHPVDWLTDMLTPRAAVELSECSFEEVREACQYLADEYQQLACVPGCQLDDGLFILDAETGRVATVAREDDVYSPGLLPRESGERAPALLRLNPALEAALITGRHEQAREVESLEWATERVSQTALLREEGDPRLEVITRAGRTSIARELSEVDPAGLLWRAGGSAARLIKHLAQRAEERQKLERITGTACSKFTLQLQDKRALNLHYACQRSLESSLPQGWVRDIARTLSYHAATAKGATLPIAATDISADLFDSAETWIGSPDVLRLIPGRRRGFLPVDGAETVGLRGCVGTLEIGSDLGVQTRELNDRWEITTSVSYVLSVDFRAIQFLPIVGIEHAASVEGP